MRACSSSEGRRRADVPRRGRAVGRLPGRGFLQTSKVVTRRTLSHVAPTPDVLPNPLGQEAKSTAVDVELSADPVWSGPRKSAQTQAGENAQGQMRALEVDRTLCLTIEFRGHSGSPFPHRLQPCHEAKGCARSGSIDHAADRWPVERRVGGLHRQDQIQRDGDDGRRKDAGGCKNLQRRG